jgi:hypothetical protein
MSLKDLFTTADQEAVEAAVEAHGTMGTFAQLMAGTVSPSSRHLFWAAFMSRMAGTMAAHLGEDGARHALAKIAEAFELSAAQRKSRAH